SAAIVNGLNSEEINAEKGLRDARFEGREATANNLAVTGSLLYYWKSLRVQVSGYYGGSVGLSSREADSLQLESGIFGTPVSLVEANFSYQKKGWSLKGLFTVANIPDANRINRAYAKNCPEQMTGYYAEAGYNVLRLFNDSTRKNLSLFLRYESVQINDKMPENGIRNEMNNQTFLTAGINYTPVHGVVIKADVNLKHTGVPNPVLQSIPFPEALPYEQDQTIFSLGLGYSF
ncbi:MAG TPA: hypothetical protein PLU53_15780, partial [Bacteroidia bacterium]|nr:hypothetical protein [Bacteroidia bacterium]